MTKILSVILLIVGVFGCGLMKINETNLPEKEFIIKKGAKIAVVPSKFGASDNYLLPNAIEMVLFNKNITVVERTSLAQIIKEKGFDFTEILNGQEYFKLGGLINVDYIIIVDAEYTQENWSPVTVVSTASIKVINVKDGTIVYIADYLQKGNRSDKFADTAKLLCGKIKASN